MINIPNLKEKLTLADEQIELLTDNTKINKILEEIIIEITGAEYASIWLYHSKSLIRQRENNTTKISMNDKEGLLYKSFMTQKSSIENYLSSTKGYVPHIDNPDNIKIKSKIMIPIVVRGVFLGIVTAYASIRKVKNFKKHDLEIFEAITPFLINTMVKMYRNDNIECVIERRSKSNKDIGKRRRKLDLDINLESYESKREENASTTADEILKKVSNIVHDIRTPANGLLGFLDILEEKTQDKRLKEYIYKAKKSASYISDLTTSILDGVSTNTTPSHSDVRMVSSIKYFSGIAEVFSAEMSQKGIAYFIYLDPRLPKYIQIDITKLKRVIINLIGNARKFTPEHGKIEFSVLYNASDKKIKISIKDNGIGIAKEKQKEIFEAFKQAEENTKEHYGGTGLGLSICAEYVQILGGKLKITSELDKGSIFYFTIPIVPDDETPILDISSKNDIHISILCNNKNMMVAKYIARYCISLGCDVKQIKAVTTLSNISDKTTHLMVFENKLDKNLFDFLKNKKQKLLIIEEDFLSLDVSAFPDTILISQYSYYGESLDSFFRTSDIPKVLIVEDDKISALLLKAILEDEYCDIDIASNGEEGEALLLEALQINKPYRIVYTDHNMPLKTGSDMLRNYEISEKKQQGKSTIVSVNISGNSHGGNESLYNFQYHATKPFKKQEILSILKKHLTD